MKTMPRAKTPVSKTVQRLLEQIAAEAQAEQLAQLSAKDGIVVLQPMERPTTSWCAAESEFFQINDKRGASVCMWRTDADRSKWTGTRTLVDGQGCDWRSSMGRYVVDDFGNLVPLLREEVPA